MYPYLNAVLTYLKCEYISDLSIIKTIWIRWITHPQTIHSAAAVTEFFNIYDVMDPSIESHCHRQHELTPIHP